MKINKTVLLTALKSVYAGVASKEVIQQSGSFVFSEDGRVYTYNDEIAISHPIDVDFTGAVPAKEFLAFVSKLKSDEVELTIDEGALKIVGSRAKAGIRLEAENKLPLDQLGEPDAWEALPDGFISAVKSCVFSASSNMNKPILQCIHVCNNTVESCDNFRATRVELADGSLQDLLIPANIVKDLALHNPTEYATTDGWLHFKNAGDVMFSCRIFVDNYPDLSPLLAKFKGTEIEFPETMNEILDRADVVSEGHPVTFDVVGGKMKISTKGDVGWFEEGVRVKYTGEDITFKTTADYLKSILRHSNKAVVSDRILRFANKSFTHILALISKGA